LVKIIRIEIPKSTRDGYPQIMFHGQKVNSIRALLPFFFTVAAFIAFAPPCARASAEDEVGQALTVSLGWVQQIDAGKYDDSYAFTCTETRDRFPQDRWVNVLKAIRRQWGSVISREQLRHVYKPNGVEGLNGECVVVTYNTNFKNMSNATETVTLKWEDGQWRGAGYWAGPTVDPNAAPAPVPDSDTQVQTQEHVKAQPQSP
jgi:hypothetical protein